MSGFQALASGLVSEYNIPVEWYATPMEVAPASDALSDFTWAQTGLHLVNTRAQYLQPIGGYPGRNP